MVPLCPQPSGGSVSPWAAALEERRERLSWMGGWQRVSGFVRRKHSDLLFYSIKQIIPLCNSNSCKYFSKAMVLGAPCASLVSFPVEPPRKGLQNQQFCLTPPSLKGGSPSPKRVVCHRRILSSPGGPPQTPHRVLSLPPIRPPGKFSSPSPRTLPSPGSSPGLTPPA